VARFQILALNVGRAGGVGDVGEWGVGDDEQTVDKSHSSSG